MPFDVVNDLLAHWAEEPTADQLIAAFVGFKRSETTSPGPAAPPSKLPPLMAEGPSATIQSLRARGKSGGMR